MNPAVLLTAQVTFVLLLAIALAWLVRRGSSRTLHLLWTATFALVLALPILGVFGPSWEVPLLPARGDESPPAAVEAATSPTSIGPAIEAGGLIATLEAAEVREAAERARLGAGADGEGAGAADGASGRSLARIAWVVWLVGCALSLASLAIAALRLRRLVRTAAPVRDPEWRREAAALRHRLGLRGDIRLLSGEAVATPMTGGWWRPVILLPASAATWSPERRAVVLAHELTHVRRRDALRQLIRRAVLALYWFHPLAWITSRHATLASEKACDEEVLALGARPSDYARHLLFLATGLPRGPRALALPIVHPSQLERRITSILARRRPHPSLARAVLTLGLLVVAGVSVAAARPVPIKEEAAGAAAKSLGELARREAAVVAARAAAAAAQTTVAAPAAVRTARPGAEGSIPPAALQEVECFPSSDSIRSFAFRGDGSVVPNWKWMDGGFTIARVVAGMRLCLRAEGDVTLNDEGTAVQSLGEDGWFVIESTGERTHRLVVTRGPEGIEREWSVGGVRRPFDADARLWRDLMFTIMNEYRDVWLSYAGGLALYGRVSGYRDELSDLRSALRDGLSEGVLREASDLDRGLREISESIKREGGTPDLKERLEEVERSLEEVLAELLAELQRVTR